MSSLRSEVRDVARAWRWGRRPLVPRSAEPYARPRKGREFPTAWARSAAGVATRDAVQRFGLDPLLRFETRPVVTGLDVLDALEGPVVFVANHSSHLDTALVLCSLPPAWRRRTAVAAAADYFFDVWWRAVGSALVFNTFPIERGGGAPTTTPGQLLAEGWNVVVYPEGTRSGDGWVGRFRPGAAYLALEQGVPVVPIAIRGSYAAMPRGRGWPKPGRPPVHVRFGAAVRPLADEEPRALSARIAAAVAQTLDEDSTTWWDAQRRAVAGATPSASGPRVARWRRVWAASESPEPAEDKPRAWR